ncbi:uncharacterized protein N7482_007566 [Penicillium canariense]|uniref:Uncharacterized protein n=1 Tax=Penicillium canariense TaxID=189055 RepID=A0A9W9LJ97_9EURO|nr:uncharacterized protein N7482_007566 [Penicillium canariense]KAJ5160562.1 hypothetical protein N7482_007566 [Penicillium canariense]
MLLFLDSIVSLLYIFKKFFIVSFPYTKIGKICPSLRRAWYGKRALAVVRPNDQDSHVVTHHTTNWPACGLSTAERTGSPVLHTLWSYVPEREEKRKK